MQAIAPETIDSFDSHNAPEIVRCKDCKHWDRGHTEECDNSDSVCFHNGWCDPDWFCADGERKAERSRKADDTIPCFDDSIGRMQEL